MILEPLSDKHWTEGGTAVTNFLEEDLSLYIAAVEQFGDSNLIVSDQPFGPMRGMRGGSLHDLLRVRRPGGLSEFWRSFREIKAAATEAKTCKFIV